MFTFKADLSSFLLVSEKIKSSLVLVILSVFIAAFLYSPVLAQSQTPTKKASATNQSKAKPTPLVPPGPPEVPINLTVSPVFIDLFVNPGESVSSQIKVRNNSSAKEYLHLTLLKFTPSASGAPVIADLTSTDEFGKWLSFDEPEFTLDPNQIRTLKFTISPPKEAALGYYYAIKIERIANTTPGAKQTSVVGAPAIPVLLDVRTANAKRELRISDFSTDSFFYEYLPVTLNVKIKNLGNIHSIPTGDIFIDSSFLGIGGGREDQKSIASIIFNDGKGNILPQTERTYITKWDDGLMVNVPNPKAGKKGESPYKLKWDLTKANKLRIGKYTAHLLMVYDNGQRDIPSEATVSFWVIPWKFVLGALLILLLAFLGLRDTFLKFIRKARGLFSSNK